VNVRSDEHFRAFFQTCWRLPRIHPAERCGASRESQLPWRQSTDADRRWRCARALEQQQGTRLNIVEVDFPAERAEDLNQQWSGV